MANELERFRARPRLRIAVAAAFCLGATTATGALIALIASTDEPRAALIAMTPPPNVAPPAIAVPVLVPFALPIAVPPPVASARPPCPPPRRDAPTARIATLPEPIAQLRLAPSNAGWIAAWNDKNIYVSDDGGATFTRVLDGPGSPIDVAFDCYGDLSALRDTKSGTQLGVRAGEIERWRSIDAQQLVGGGPDIIAYFADLQANLSSTLAISDDRGATWRYHSLGDYSESKRVSGRQLEDGTVEIATAFGDCMNDELETFTLRGDRLATETKAIGEGDGFARYGGVELATASTASSRRIGHDFADIAGLPELPSGEGVTWRPLEGPVPTLTDGTRLYRVAGRRARRLPVDVRGVAQVVDAAGRVWCIADGQPLIARAPAPPITEGD